MKLLSEVLAPEKIVACPSCGGFAWFDWGVKLLHQDPGGIGPRVRDWSTSGQVNICVSCHHPVVWMGGDYYDGSEVIPKDQIQALIREGQARTHQVPVRAMDP